MIVALDVQYDDSQSRGTAAAVVFERWGDPTSSAEYTTVVENVQPYVPGEFFRRELPCLAAIMSRIREPVTAIVVDGYVRLNGRPGLAEDCSERVMSPARMQSRGPCRS